MTLAAFFFLDFINPGDTWHDERDHQTARAADGLRSWVFHAPLSAVLTKAKALCYLGGWKL